MAQVTSQLITFKKQWLLFTGAILLALALSYLNVSLPWFIFLGGVVFLTLTIAVFRQPLLGLALVAFSLPFERVGAYEFGAMTIRISQLFLVVTALAWFLNAVVQRKYTLAKNPLLVPLGAFLAINILSLTNALNIERSLLVLLFIVFTAFLAFLVPHVVTTSHQVRKVILVLTVSFVIVSAFGLFQFLGDMVGLPPEVTGLRELYTKEVLGFTRIQSTAYEPLYFANYLLIPLGLLLALFLSGSNVLRAGWLVFLFGLGMVNLILTVSRGGYLAIFFTVLVVGLFYFRKLMRPTTIALIIVATVLVGWVTIRALGISGDFFTAEKFQEHVRGVFYGASYEERVETFDRALAAWREHPLIGIGVGGFGPYVAPHPYYMPKDGWKIVNNEFIEVLTENGALGLLFLGLFFLMLIIRSVKAISVSGDKYLKAIMVGLLGALIGVLVQYQTFSTLYIMHIWFLLGLMVAVQNIIFGQIQNVKVKMKNDS